MTDLAYTIAELTFYIRTLFERDERLQDVWVQGEISNMKRAASGHWYFTLKDSDAQLKCVMWRSNAEKQSVAPSDGDAILAHGYVSLYEAQGAYQLYVDQVRPLGAGDLYAQFERLKTKLEAEGLFDSGRKRPLPTFPRVIGVVTSPEAAAFQDIQNVLRRRCPLVELLLSPTLVQGAEAPAQIVRAIERLNAQGEAEVLLLIRGGGSIEDLWAFNDERVARAVAASHIPVISGVGHETDFTIVDFVADLRAPTPSAAAELAAPDVAELRMTIETFTTDLQAALEDRLAAARASVEAAQRTLRHVSPLNRLRGLRQRVDERSTRLSSALAGRLALRRERVGALNARLSAADPRAILRRGYARVTRSDDGQPVRAARGVAPGTGLTLTFQDDELTVRVEDKETHGRYKRTLF